MVKNDEQLQDAIVTEETVAVEEQELNTQADERSPEEIEAQHRLDVFMEGYMQTLSMSANIVYYMSLVSGNKMKTCVNVFAKDVYKYLMDHKKLIQEHYDRVKSEAHVENNDSETLS